MNDAMVYPKCGSTKVPEKIAPAVSVPSADQYATYEHPSWMEIYKTEVLGGWCGEPPERPDSELPNNEKFDSKLRYVLIES